MPTSICGLESHDPGARQEQLTDSDTTSAGHYPMLALRLGELPVVSGVAGWVKVADKSSDRVVGVQDLGVAQNELDLALSVLTATFDSSPNGLLVVDTNRSITSFNRRFTEMWALPQSIVECRDDVRAVAFMSDQLLDPQGFNARIDELYAQPEKESADTIVLRDGRVFERFSYPQLLAGACVGRVWTFIDVTDRQRLESELAHLTLHDQLTGLANRALFRDRVAKGIAQVARRPGSSAAVLLLDIDDFKTINDSMGHSAGDDLLIAVATRLRACLGPSETLARLGEDEFAVLVDDMDDHDVALGLAGRIASAMREPIEIADKRLTVRVSIGVAYTSADDHVDELLSNADLAMRTAKRRDRDRVIEFEPMMYTAVLARRELEADLRQAIAEGEFEVHYQPIIDLRTSVIVGFEALSRWRHPRRGLLPPSEFIAFAEEIGLIAGIDRLMLGQAITEARSWQVAGLAPPELLISVNLSAREVVDPEIEERVVYALRESGFEPANLILEVTESVVLEDVEGAIRNLTNLAALGVQIAMDDFGTGYSSFSHLERLPVDILKIDQSFLACIRATEDVADLAYAIIQLSGTLGVTPIAEGVETAIQVGRLRQMGCHLAQGYYLGMPLDAAATRALLARAPSSSGTRNKELGR